MDCCGPNGDTVTGLACVPDAIEASERRAHFGLAHDLLQERAQERRELPDGFAFRFRAAEFDALLRFVGNERKCCPFLSFELGLTPQRDEAWLRMTGPEGTADLLRAELNQQGGCGCKAEAGHG